MLLILLMIDWLTRKQKVKIEGKYNYYLNLNTEFVDSSTSISITSFTDKNKKAAVPCSYIWFAIKNGLPIEVQDFRGSTFICDTNHIGYFIQAHIVVPVSPSRATTPTSPARPSSPSDRSSSTSPSKPTS